MRGWTVADLHHRLGQADGEAEVVVEVAGQLFPIRSVSATGGRVELSTGVVMEVTDPKLVQP